MLRCFRRRSNWAVKSYIKGVNFKFQDVKCVATRPAVQERHSSGGGNEQYSVGNIYNGFICTDIQYVKEFNMTAIMLQHERSRTEYLHLQRDDSNNVFSINFRTTPFNSTGLPHILEHTVLCGSKKYPVRDPFFKMLNRSLATFMNAMTGPDYTFYPFSSQNEVDYRNLQSIYLDAVFHPNLNRLDFLQEGWRLEHSNVNDPKSDLTFKGVVFNEMKGAFSENVSVFGEKFLNTILPDHTYGYISGGDPLEIPNLTVQQLQDFHAKYYHPSNARMYSYGNFPLEKNLNFVNQMYLGNVEGIDSSYSSVPSQPRWVKPSELQIKSRFDKVGAPFEKQNQIAIGYLMCDVTDVYESFVLFFLSQLMVMGPNSPFYKSLIEPNISGGFNSMTGYDSQMKDTMFIIGLQDLEIDKFDLVKSTIDETLDKIITEGFDKTHIESVLHGIELSLKHQYTRFGLNTLFNIVALWNHQGPVLEALQVSKCLDRFKENIKNPNYLKERVEHYFKQNNHRLTLTMVPDNDYEKKVEKMEAELLMKKISELTLKDKEMVYTEGLKLAETQKTEQNIDILPCLRIEDIPKELEPFKLKHITKGNVPVQMCEANTNDVTYFQGILNMSHLPANLKHLVPLFNATVSKMNTLKYSFREFDQLINLKTGGLCFSTHVAEKIDNPNLFEEGIILYSHALDQNVEGMFSIWSELFQKPLYNDVDRFQMLLENYLSNLTTGIADRGHLYAIQCANSLVSPGGLMKEELGGLKHIDYMKNLVLNDNPKNIMLNVASISDHMFTSDRLRTALNMSNTNKEKILDKFEHLCKNMVQRTENSGIHYSKGKKYDSSVRCVHHVLNFPVNFCAKSIVTVPFTSPDFAKLRVLAKFLSSKYLHPVVREQNGAYGGGAKLGTEGIFNFYSYRDPNSRVTLDVFDNTANWFESNAGNLLTDQSLFEAKLGVLQLLDAPVAEFHKGIEEFLLGISRGMLQQHRSQVLSVTKQDLADVCIKYLANDDKAVVGKCVIGMGKNSAGEMDLYRNGEEWTVVEPIKDML